MTSHRHALRHLLARGLLALMLVLAQQEATLHWLSHAIDATHGKAPAGSSTAADDHCDECLTLGGLATGATSTPYHFPQATTQHVLVAASEVATAPAQLRLGFRSRAPPVLS